MFSVFFQVFNHDVTDVAASSTFDDVTNYVIYRILIPT